MVWLVGERHASHDLSRRGELEIRHAYFVAALHQESEFPVREFVLGLGPGVQRDPLLILLDPLDQRVWRNLNLDGPGLILAVHSVLEPAVIRGLAVDEIADSET